MQNKPKIKFAEMNLSIAKLKDYKNSWLYKSQKTKPNKANFTCLEKIKNTSPIQYYSLAHFVRLVLKYPCYMSLAKNKRNSHIRRIKNADQ